MAWLVAAATTGCDTSPEPAAPAGEPTPLGIVSLTPGVSLILLELGVADQIVAADAASTDLPGVGGAVDLGALDDAAASRVAALTPDLVIGLADERSRVFAARLEVLGIHAVLLAPRTANEVDAALLRIGELVNQGMRARLLAGRTAREVAEIATRRDGKARRRVALVLRCQPLTVVGGAGLIHETLELAGAENVFHEPGLEERIITTSELAQRAPELVLDASGAGPASTCSDAAGSGARAEPLSSQLTHLPALDLLARVRSLHEILYSGE